MPNDIIEPSTASAPTAGEAQSVLVLLRHADDRVVNAVAAAISRDYGGHCPGTVWLYDARSIIARTCELLLDQPNPKAEQLIEVLATAVGEEYGVGVQWEPERAVWRADAEAIYANLTGLVST